MQMLTTKQEADREDDRSGHRHRQLIGYIGLVLPVVLILVVLRRDGLEFWELLDSISAYYYTGAVAAFVGMLVSLALFLLTYRGYDNKYQWADRAAAWIAGVAAIGVAAFPTAAPTDELMLPWWTETTGTIHYASAIVLFSMFAIFCLFLFCLGSTTWRKWIYRTCGAVIVLSMIWAVVAGLREQSIFAPESVALVAFAISWLVKGNAQRSIASSMRTLMGRG